MHLLRVTLEQVSPFCDYYTVSPYEVALSMAYPIIFTDRVLTDTV